MSANGHHVTGVLQAPGLQWVGDDSTLALHDVVTRTEVSTGHRQPSRSDTLVRLGALEMTSRTREQTTWAMTGAEVRAAATATEETLQELNALVAARGDRGTHSPHSIIEWYLETVKRIDPSPLG